MTTSHRFSAVLDSCVLIPPVLCDLLLRCAETPRLFVPKWSAAILDEVHRNQIEKLLWPESLANHWRAEVEASFPEAIVARFESRISECTNHPKDRHVLAAAIHIQADVIVTQNLRDFPDSSVQD